MVLSVFEGWKKKKCFDSDKEVFPHWFHSDKNMVFQQWEKRCLNDDKGGLSKVVLH